MYENLVLGVANEAMVTILLVSAPILGGALLTGLLISILQATTQLQEMTLVFVPKIVVVMLVIIIFGPWMLNVVTSFTSSLYASIPQFVTW
ncbi:MAG: flagellar biosynthesis protein FliQ [Syntrophomonadaceae bacterium]|jgi:flagellar biosynthetic protein FliQ|nr:flagellar biosynthesis protein FliQ [Bacillota bacterium]NLP25535.1 flagellar biosynthesis protein FliQ [Syntrophomonadaceae bacterium]